MGSRFEVAILLHERLIVFIRQVEGLLCLGDIGYLPCILIHVGTPTEGHEAVRTVVLTLDVTIISVCPRDGDLGQIKWPVLAK